MPVLVIHGEQDPLVSFESARTAANTIPNAHFIGVPGLGHDLPHRVAIELIPKLAAFHSRLATSPLWNRGETDLISAS